MCVCFVKDLWNWVSACFWSGTDIRASASDPLNLWLVHSWTEVLLADYRMNPSKAWCLKQWLGFEGLQKAVNNRTENALLGIVYNWVSGKIIETSKHYRKHTRIKECGFFWENDLLAFATILHFLPSLSLSHTHTCAHVHTHALCFIFF